MATYTSRQMAEDYRSYPIDDHGKLRMQYADVPALTAAYAANDQITLFKLPPGRKRVIIPLSRISFSAFGAGRTLNIGHRAYSARPTGLADPEAENATAFVTGLDVSAAGNAVSWGTTLKYDMYSIEEVEVFATIVGGTMPVGATLAMFMSYLYE